MKKLYSCEQRDNESVQSFATRLEDIFDKSVALKALKMSDKGLLKDLLHSGLKNDMKRLTIYQRDRYNTYEELKREIRKIETDFSSKSTEDRKTCKSAVIPEKKQADE